MAPKPRTLNPKPGDGGDVPRLVVWGGCCNHVYLVRPPAAAASEAVLLFDQTSREADAPGFEGYRTHIERSLLTTYWSTGSSR